MIAETLMMGGWLMMTMRRQRRLVLEPMPGEVLRAAFGAPVTEAVPETMLRELRRVDVPLRIVAGGRDL